GSSSFQNGSCGSEDACRAMVRDFLFCSEPVLNVATAKVRSFETECFATDERNGFGFDFADMSGSLLTIHELFSRGVSKNNVGKFVKRGLVREGRNGAYGDFASVRKTLNIAVYLVKRCASDVQVEKRCFGVKAGNRRDVGLFT